MFLPPFEKMRMMILIPILVDQEVIFFPGNKQDGMGGQNIRLISVVNGICSFGTIAFLTHSFFCFCFLRPFVEVTGPHSHIFGCEIVL